METVTPTQSYSGVLLAGRSMTITGPASGTGTVALNRSGTTVQSTNLTSGQSLTFGPYNLDVNYKVSTTAGSMTLTFQEAFLQVSGNSFPTSDGSKTVLTTGASATVLPGTTDIVLDGVGTTFALTFPAPLYDGQVLRVMAATAVSVGFSAVVTAPGTVIKTVPTTLAAGVGIAWKYNESNTTWYRMY